MSSYKPPTRKWKKRCARCGSGCGSKHDECTNCRRESAKQSEHRFCAKCGETFLFFFKTKLDTCPECRRKAAILICANDGCGRRVADRRYTECSICRDTEPVTLSLAAKTAGEKSPCDSCICAACANILSCPMHRGKPLIQVGHSREDRIPILVEPNRCNQVCGGNKQLYPLTIAPRLVFDAEGVCKRDEKHLAEEGPRICPGFVLQEDLRP